MAQEEDEQEEQDGEKDEGFENLLKEPDEDELEKVFENSEEKVKDDFKELAINDNRTRYLKNIGIPSQVKIDIQRSIQWYKEDGVLVRLETISDLTDPEDKEKARSYGVTVGEGQKCWLYFYNGEYKSNRITFFGDTFKVLSFPQLINFTVGTNKRDEKKYTLLVGRVVSISRPGDAEVIIERFKYVVETDKNGNFDREKSEYLRGIGVKVKKLSDDVRVDWGSMDVVPLSSIRKSSPDAQPITLTEALDSEVGDVKNS